MNKEKKIRKHWFIAFFIFYGLFYLSHLVEILVGNFSLYAKFGLTIFLSVFVFLAAGMLYDCAYEKPGTKLLMWTLFMLPSGFARSIQKVPFANLDLADKLWLLVWLVLYLYFWINCYRLRRINKIKKIQN